MLELTSRHDAAAYAAAERFNYSKTGQALSAEERTRKLARSQSDPYGFYYGDLPSTLVVTTTTGRLEVIGGGPVQSGVALRAAVTALRTGDARYADQLGGGYGLHIHFQRQGDRVVLSRARGKIRREDDGTVTETVEPETEESRLAIDSAGNLGGALAIEASWADFERAVDQYWSWLLTDYPSEAPWVLEVPEFQEFIRERNA